MLQKFDGKSQFSYYSEVTSIESASQSDLSEEESKTEVMN